MGIIRLIKVRLSKPMARKSQLIGDISKVYRASYGMGSNKRRKSLSNLIRWYKEHIPCYDCHNYYPWFVITFDHTDRGEKIDDIGNLIGGGLKKLIDEIHKCDLVCLNCHKIRERKRDYGTPSRAYILKQLRKAKSMRIKRLQND